MSVVLAVSLLGMCALALCGFLGRTGRTTDLAEWAVGQRNFGTLAMWFLQAGEVFTTFSFLGVAGVAYAGGNAATYAMVYLALAFLLLYFIQPRLWRLGERHGYLTQADYFTQRYGSPLYGKVIAVIGLVFLIPYLQLQITGLGMVVGLVTGSTASGRLSMVLASVLTAAFVLWSGIRGLKNSAYFKDVLTLGVMLVLAIAVPLHYTGGLGEVFRQVHEVQPQMLTVHSGERDRTWWTTSVLTSALAGGLMATPHHWPPLMAAGGPRAIRTNNVFMPLYQIALMIPITIGFTGMLVARPGGAGDPDGILLTLAQGALPGWATGLVVVAAAASAMVPAGAMCVGISTLVARNLLPARREAARMAVNHSVVVLAIGLALTLGILRPGLLADLQLLTVSGFIQIVPGLLAAIGRRRLLTAPGALAGLVTGEAVVTWLTLAEVETHHVNAGLVALAVNVLVAAAVTALFRRPAASPTMDSARGAHSAPGAHEDRGTRKDGEPYEARGPRTRAATTIEEGERP
ncbi:sodium:solute symporter family protein [Streptomyces sp. Inha503]|uniref:sodium:solute symporter family protein n=1 Tax=Streptomyces sp. Inha503 TaxID=3383314 RepID=UPI00399F349B